MNTQNKIANYTLCSISFEISSNYEANLQTLLQHIKECPSHSIITAPEVCLSGFDYKNLQKAVDFSKKAEEQLKKVSHHKVIILTMLDTQKNKIYNIAKIFFRGDILYQRAKARLFHLGDEHKYMEEGDDKDIQIITIDGIKIALLICFELRFKELWQKVEGADVIAVLSYWGALRKEHFYTLTKALAIINQCYVLATDARNKDCTKINAIISPQGSIYQDDTKNIITLPFSKKEIKKMRRYLQVGIK
ncbi:Aliphatic amidase AmiE [hydrothermal vent metagenome]|uniref:Aliphatic amidase AmiE n=1 Tax=hydrothermal vent metagenome TaxID=652676 RepID=A0A1W1D631_9ZZZZ